VTRRLLIFVLAGEPSGDVLGGRLMAALKAASDDPIEFIGVGGPAMRAQGLDSLFPMAELSVMGIVEILPHIRRLFARMRQSAAAIDAAQPDCVVTIDAPAFAHGVAKRIRNRTIPRIHYVAPQLWAWRPWRVHKFKRHFDHLLGLLPFEPAWFARHGVSCKFVGHPVIENAMAAPENNAFRQRHGIALDAPVVCVLLGSRKGEVARLAPPFRETLARLESAHPGLVVILPTVPNVAASVRDFGADCPARAIVVESTADKPAALAACNVGLAASGTATLELSLAGVPLVVAYRLATLTYLIAKPLMRVRFANLINLILDREVVPEFLQGNCRAEKLAPALSKLFGPEGARQKEAVQPALKQLGMGDRPPSARAASAVLDIIAGRA
jgi:lipid-A-disaccharide synthase